MSDSILEQPRIEFAFMADHATADQSGINVSGGARDVFFNPKFDERLIQFAFVVGVLIPWSMAGQWVNLRYRLEDEDGRIMGEPLLRPVRVNLVGNEEEGQALRLVTAETASWPVPRAMTYALILRIDEGAEYRVTFHIREPRNEQEWAATKPLPD